MLAQRTLYRVALMLGVALLPCLAEAQRAMRIGVLHPGSAGEPASVQRLPFESALRELGWKPGADLRIEYRYAEGDIGKLPQLAAELAALQVRVIVARGASAINAARTASPKTPIVMSAGNDPIAEGFVQNLSRPGGFITGIALLTFELDAKRLELLKDTFPAIKRVAVLTNRDNEPKVNRARLSAIHDSAKALGLQLEFFEVRKSADIPQALAAIGRYRADAMLVRAEPIVMDRHRRDIAEAAARHRIPAIYWWRFYVDDGGLMSFGESIPGFHHKSAGYVDRILRGANPAELAIERPSKFEFVINLKAARALGVEIPKSVLFRADQLIE
jgi:putative tryptophan/tyrosine transport system substrate-binding protein